MSNSINSPFVVTTVFDIPEAQRCQSCNGTCWEPVCEEGERRVRKCQACVGGRQQSEADALVVAAQIPDAYGHCTFASYRPATARQTEALKACSEWADSWESKGYHSLVLSGSSGCGKTHLAVATLRAVIRQHRVSGRFMDECRWLREVQSTYGPGATETSAEVVGRYADVGLLLWDDMGTGRPTEWAQETWRELIDFRYSWQIPVIATTNFCATGGASEALAERIGQRLLSRLTSGALIVEVSGPDARRNAKRV